MKKLKDELIIFIISSVVNIPFYIAINHFVDESYRDVIVFITMMLMFVIVGKAYTQFSKAKDI